MKHPFHRTVAETSARNFQITFCTLLLTSSFLWGDEGARLLHKSSAVGTSSNRGSFSLPSLAPKRGTVDLPASEDSAPLTQIAQSDDDDEAVPAKKQAPRTQAANTGLVASRPTASASTAAKEPSDQPDPNDYIIGEQDNLTITVWKEKELSGSVVVRPDGKITVPLVGETKVVGMTPIQLQNLLELKLKPYIAVPQVTVAVSQINSRRVYLIGQVVKEGSYQINSSTTVLQLIAQAGGLRDFAKRKNIYILRNQGSEQNRFSFNYEAVVRGKNQDQNILLQPGDTIVVP